MWEVIFIIMLYLTYSGYVIFARLPFVFFLTDNAAVVCNAFYFVLTAALHSGIFAF